MHIMKWVEWSPAYLGYGSLVNVWGFATIFIFIFLCRLDKQPQEALHIIVNVMKGVMQYLDTSIIASVYSMPASHVRYLQSISKFVNQLLHCNLLSQYRAQVI